MWLHLRKLPAVLLLLLVRRAARRLPRVLQRRLTLRAAALGALHKATGGPAVAKRVEALPLLRLRTRAAAHTQTGP
jgi:hypothetical protein